MGCEFTMRKSDRLRVHDEEKSDEVRVDYERKSGGVSVEHERKSDGLRVQHEKEQRVRVHHKKEGWRESSPWEKRAMG